MVDFTELSLERRKQLKARIERQRIEREEMQQRLAEKYGVVGNPKLEKCFDLAWDYGHSSGEVEIDGYFCELVELIK